MALDRGTKLGPYEILSPLGAGGMGEVYRALDPRLGREVAIKVLPERLANDPSALARFKQEAKAAAALAHPNILVIHDVGEDAGIHYAVTELLEGETLRERLDRSPLPWRRAIEVAIQLAEGLAAAHSKDIAHRDIKPANVFLTDGRVKILDFGLARWQPKLSEQDRTVTLADAEAGLVMGTVGYMSPEQVRGEAAGPASDIFSLGIVLYEMVTGRRPFGGKSAAETMSAILTDDPPALADSGVQASPEMARIIERCLAKNSAQRFHSAHDLAFALRTLSSVSGDKPVESLPAPGRRRAWQVAIAAALVALVGTGGWMYFRVSSKAIDSLAVLPFANTAGADTDWVVDGITDSLIDSLSQLPKLRVMSHSAVFRYKGKDADARTVGRELGVRAILTGRIVQRGQDLSVRVELVNVDDNTAIWGEQYNRNLMDALAVQNDIAHQIVEKLKLRLSNDQMSHMEKHQTGNPEAYQLYLKGRYFAGQFTKENEEKGLDYLRQAIALDPNYALAYDGLSYFYSNTEEWLSPATEAMPKAKEAALKAIELDESLPAPHVEMGGVHMFYDFDWAAAEREFHRAIELNPNYAPAHEFYGWYLAMIGRGDSSGTEGRRAVELDPLSAEIESIFGWSLYYSHRYDESAAELRKCLDLQPNYQLCLIFLAQAYQQQNRSSEAIEALKKARKIDDSIPWTLGTMAYNYAKSGQTSEARKVLDELLARSKRGYVPAYMLALAYIGLGERNSALAQLEQAYEQRSFFMDYLKTDPELDSLRSEPRFQELMGKMNFPQ